MPKHIVVVEDDANLLQILTKLLKKEGYLVTSAADGQAGLVAAMRDRPDLLILDVNLPVMDGFEVCERLKQDPTTKSIPVIIMTAAYDTPESAKKGLALGAAEYIIKPFMHLPFLFTVKRILGDVATKASGDDESAS